MQVCFRLLIGPILNENLKTGKFRRIAAAWVFLPDGSLPRKRVLKIKASADLSRWTPGVATWFDRMAGEPGRWNLDL